MQAVGVAEDNIFKKRKEDEVQRSALIKENNQWFQLHTQVFYSLLSTVFSWCYSVYLWLCEGSICFL